MIVMKFGGTSVGSPERIRDVATIVKSSLSQKPVVVVSALGGITDSLIDAANSFVNKGEGKNKLELIMQRHYQMIDSLDLEQDIIENEAAALAAVMQKVSKMKTLNPKIMDTVVSFGERMSAKIVAAYITNMGIPAKAFNAYDIGMITNSNFGDADVLPESYSIMKKSLSKVNEVPIITGFIGKDKKGNITTLGRGGSDYTGSIIGAGIDAKEIQIWTDVNGIMTADPRVVKNAKTINEVSYAEASELAFLGAKVLHPKTILPAVSKNIPVRILNTFNPSHKGTLVLKDIKAKSRIASITAKKKIQVINLTTPKMFQMHGFMKNIFEIFDKHNASIDMISTSEVSVSITLDGKQNTNTLVADLKKLANVNILPSRAKVSIVGKKMVYIPRVLVRWSSAMEGIQIEMMSSSISEVNDGFVVEEKYADEAVRRLHKAFFGR